METRSALGALDRGGPAPALWAALACAVGIVITGVVALLVPAAHRGDAGTLRGFVALNRPRLTPLADLLAHSVDPAPYALAGLALVAVALLRRRPRMAIVIAAALVATVVTCEVLKPLLSNVRQAQWFGDSSLGGASWPSGHAAGAMCVALCTVLVSPRWLRALTAAAGTALAVGVSFSILVLAWHFPSDVLGGFLVAALWVALGIAYLRARESAPRAARAALPARSTRAPTPTPTPPPAPAPAVSLAAPVMLAAIAAGGVALAVVLRPEAVATFAAAHKPFLVGASAIAALAWTLASGLALALRR